MSEVAGRRRFPARKPVCISSAVAAGISVHRKPRRRRRRFRSNAFPGGGRRSGPSTPFLRWNFKEACLLDGEPPLEPAGEVSRKGKKTGGEARPVASARRLAARIWHHWLPEAGGEGKTSLGLELEDKQACSISNVSTLRSELELARSRVSELEDEQLSAQKKLNHFVRKIEDEKSEWKRREHEKIRSIIDAVKEDLNIRRKNRHRLQIMNTKLVNELNEAKLSAKQFLQEYEKERKTRELMEEVCNELAKEIGDDKAEGEVLKIESMKNKEEVEQERKMLQMAEVWREERVQMKLTHAKLMLEVKYSQLSKLYEEIEAFLRSRNGNSFDASKMKQAEALKESVRSLKTHEMRELT